MGRGAARVGLQPGGELRGSLRVPGSKSIAQRALVCAGLASGSTRIAGLPEGDDVRAAIDLVGACGPRVERLAPLAVAITGRPPGGRGGWVPAGPVSASESGTLARLSTAVLAFAGAPARWHEIRGEGSLLRRRSPALFDALARADVGTLHLGAAGGWPARVKAIGPPSQVSIENPTSSQEVSALLVALAAWPDEIALTVRGSIPSAPYVELTRSVLARFGAKVAERSCVQGPLVAPGEPITIEPDASSAAVALAAGCLSGGRVEVAGLRADSLQPDARAIALLERFGCRIGWSADGVWAEGAPSRGAEVDCADAPDLAPVLAAVAAGAASNGGGASRIGGLSTLSGKESSRIEVLARGLRAAGLEVGAGSDALEIGPPRTSELAEAVVLDPDGDHRMAFAFALLGLVRDGVWSSDPACVAKSWPGFWVDLGRLGAKVVRREA